MSVSTRTLHHSVTPPGMPWALPALTIEAVEPGPRVAITANLHGDECIGLGVVHELVRTLPVELLRGAVRLYPSLNPEGLRAGCRRTAGDGSDMNRVFPGDPNGDGAERTAHAVWRDLLGFGPALVLDLHADSCASIPYAILDRLITVQGAERARRRTHLERLARASGLTVVRDYREAPYRRFHLDRSLSGALLNHARIDAFTMELGTRRLLEPAGVAAGTAAVLGVLTELGLVAHPASPHPSQVGGGPWRRDSGPVTRTAGVLRPLHPAGAILTTGTVLATVHALDGALVDRLEVRSRSLVLALAERAWLPPGESAATIAVPDE